ncbi:MAG: sigma-54 dependent transcriptional regulator [Spirochaetes bacterium]|nr:sigma-54 dependent transcriptional regulator [Spirochaetota bacterium]
MSTILVIDDEPGIRTTVRDILEDERYKVVTAEDGIVGLEAFRTERPDLIVLDVRLPRMGGMEVLGEMKKLRPDIEIIVISGHGTIDMAVQAVKLGAFDFLEKPLSIDRLLTSVRNATALGSLRAENRRLKRVVREDDAIIGESAPIREIRTLIEQAARSDARVLITGPNGTGKELAARRIHALGRRAEGPFVEVNCAAIPDTLIESELFGHEKGAFTDAVSRRRGRFEAAHGGTLFLDEAADLTPAAQAKLLRVLQEMRFERLGGEESIEVDVRVIAATNKDISAEIAAGRFREDLYFRLNVVPIRMPPLSERPEDVPVLCSYFLQKLAQTEGAPRTISPEAMEALRAYPWPGNVRELKNFIERLCVMSDEDTISAGTVTHFLGKSGRSKPKAGRERPLVPEEFSSLKLSAAKDFFEKSMILQKLRENGYNVARTAEALGLYPSNLHSKIKKYGIGGVA